MSRSIMIIGASGRLGLALIRAAAAHSSNPSIHAFVRTPSNIPSKQLALCETVQKGDALHSEDIKRALHITKADTVIITIGVPNSVAKSQLRTDSAKALMSSIKSDSSFQHVRVVCVSALGAGGSTIIAGFGIGTMITFWLRKVLVDHDHQEETFINGMGKINADHLLIVRPTGLVDGKPGRDIVTFGDHDKVPSLTIDREDLATYITDQVCGSSNMFGNAVNITAV